jgi:hypothetical protein
MQKVKIEIILSDNDKCYGCPFLFSPGGYIFSYYECLFFDLIIDPSKRPDTCKQNNVSP